MLGAFIAIGFGEIAVLEFRFELIAKILTPIKLAGLERVDDLRRQLGVSQLLWRGFIEHANGFMTHHMLALSLHLNPPDLAAEKPIAELVAGFLVHEEL